MLYINHTSLQSFIIPRVRAPERLAEAREVEAAGPGGRCIIIIIVISYYLLFSMFIAVIIAIITTETTIIVIAIARPGGRCRRRCLPGPGARINT